MTAPLLQELLDSLHEGREQRASLARRGLLEGLERLALLGVELPGDFEHDAITEIAAPSTAQVRHALAAQAQDLERLRARGDLQHLDAVEQRDFEVGAQCEMRERHG